MKKENKVKALRKYKNIVDAFKIVDELLGGGCHYCDSYGMTCNRCPLKVDGNDCYYALHPFDLMNDGFMVAFEAAKIIEKMIKKDIDKK